jgi:LuxR family transcriptional regulator, maltose regulon positive regulatory protein
MTISIPISASLMPPRSAGLLTRPRLLDKLSALLDDRRLILVIAPPGYGKTTLLVDFAHEDEFAVCWYTIDPWDAGMPTFLPSFIQAVARRLPDFAEPALSALQAHTDGLFSSEQLVTRLANEFHAASPYPHVLVIDDAQLALHEPEIGRFLLQFLHRAGPLFRLVLLARQPLDFPGLDLLAARGQVGHIGRQDLAFTIEEIQSLSELTSGRPLDRAAAVELQSTSAGWIAGLQLGHDRPGVLPPGLSLDLYLARQVLEPLPETLARFLLLTSYFTIVEPGICERVLGGGQYLEQQDWPALVASVVHSPVDTHPVEGLPLAYRYHPQLQAFLKAEMQRRLPDTGPGILLRLAAELRDGGHLEAAWDLYRQLDDRLAMAGLAEELGTRLLRRGQIRRLAELLTAFSAAELEAHAGLLSLRGAIQVLCADLPGGMRYLEQAAQLAGQAGDLERLALALSRRAHAFFQEGDYRTSLKITRELLELLPDGPQVAHLRAGGMKLAGLNLLWCGEVGAAFEHLQAALAIFDRLDDHDQRAVLQQELGLAYRLTGQYQAAETCYQQALSCWQAQEKGARMAHLLNNLGVLYHQRGSYVEASQAYCQALELAQAEGQGRLTAYIYSGIAALYADVEAWVGADLALADGRRAASAYPHTSLALHIDLLSAAIARRSGDLPEARRQLGLLPDPAARPAAPYEIGQYLLELALVAQAGGEHEPASQLAARAAEAFERAGRPLEACLARLHLAGALSEAGCDAQAFQALDELCGRIEGFQNLHFLVVPALRHRAFLEQALASQPEGSPLGRFLRELNLFESGLAGIRRALRQLPQAVPFDPPDLTVRVLGKPEVVPTGVEVISSTWSSKTAREIFFYLLAQRTPLKKASIALALWPDHSQKSINIMWKISLHRIRKYAGRSVVVRDEDGSYHFNRSLDYVCDAENFTRLVEQAEAEEDASARVNLCRAAIDSYSGEYLPDFDADWVLVERRLHQERFYRACLLLAKDLLDSDDPHGCLALCRRVLESDPCREEAHLLAMRAHLAGRDRVGAARQFESCQQVLDEQLQITPSPAMWQLYKRLQKQ